MFDWVNCDLPLEVDGYRLDHYKGRFQTKDLNNLMETYTITKEKKLVLSSNRFSDKLDLDFTGKINFYTFFIMEDDRQKWFEFIATFDKGMLVSIEPNLKSMKEFDERMNKKSRFKGADTSAYDYT